MAKKKTATYILGMGLTGLPKGKRKHVSRRKYLGKDNWGIDRIDYIRPKYDYSNHVRKYYGE